MSGFQFDMSLECHFALFRDSDRICIVESFDNQTFEVYVGTFEHSTLIGTVTAASSAELNAELKRLVEQHA